MGWYLESRRFREKVIDNEYILDLHERERKRQEKRLKKLESLTRLEDEEVEDIENE